MPYFHPTRVVVGFEVDLQAVLSVSFTDSEVLDH